MTNIHQRLQAKPPKNGNFYTLIIDGRAGSGKTELANYLSKLLPDFTFLNGDDYFEPTPNEIAWGAFNDSRFKADVLDPIKRGETKLRYKPYDWHSEPHITERTIIIDKGVCIERSYGFSFDLDWDIKIWVEVPAELASKRAIERDQMPEEQAMRAYEQIWKPADAAHFEKVRPLQTADIIIDGTRPFSEQIIA